MSGQVFDSEIWSFEGSFRLLFETLLDAAGAVFCAEVGFISENKEIVRIQIAFLEIRNSSRNKKFHEFGIKNFLNL